MKGVFGSPHQNGGRRFPIQETVGERITSGVRLNEFLRTTSPLQTQIIEFKTGTHRDVAGGDGYGEDP